MGSHYYVTILHLIDSHLQTPLQTHVPKLYPLLYYLSLPIDSTEVCLWFYDL